ncbi:DNA repair-scaffolding protein isoform X2 [Cuculus canorus]|uniref:DNA repair-scaffolding protein isoform X2 n=1 Tax=Cuculus canorus TaxID=55661 RepID=UPI0023AB094D|nr:DNA repair-scaffolding protein isoform X2 [Cuculus canorus]
MPSRKRKRFWDAECTPFPDETPLLLKKSNVRTSGAATSISNAWLRCGDGFQSTSVLESLRPTDKKSRIRKHLGPLLTSAESAAGSVAAESSKEAEDITWTSSGSDFSDCENKTLIPRLHNKKSHGSRTEESPSRPDLLLEDSSSEEELEFIDWGKDSDSTDKCDGSEKDDGSLEISDSDSCTDLNSLPVKEENDELCKCGFQHIFVRVPRTLCSVKSQGDVGCWLAANLGQVHSNKFQWQVLLPKPCQFCLCMTTSVEISEYSSDNDSVEEGETGLVTATPGSTKRLWSRSGEDTDGVTAQPASEWLRSAQALLHTPGKQAGKAPRAPTESAKKRKLLRGGLAERLCRLQNRERSAISFWRHQCTSDTKISSDKSGVLIVKILEMFEECTIQVAICQQLQQTPATLSSEDAVINAGEPILKVLFVRETAAHLKSRPQDVIHIYPPWQKLLLKNADVPVIMNTYFSQKVLLSEHSEAGEKTYSLTNMVIRKNIISLAQTFRLDDLDDELHQADNQVACTPQIHNNCDSKQDCLALNAVNDSLLEMVESQGAVGWREVQVRVVIQRVYCLPAREGYGSHVQGNKPLCATSVTNSDLPNVRLCLLVQDAYGMFSEVQLQSLSSAGDVEQYCRRWEGKFCCLAGMKILQRTTRGRALGLFSLIDSLWPPVVPVKVPGQSQGSEMMTTELPPPSFCYILTVQSGEIHVEVDEEEQISNLYQPPVVHGLQEILQMDGCNERCSFWAQVLYLRLQTKHSVPLNQREIWLFVTDSTLQNVAHMIPKVVAVSVAASCVLSAEITEALSVASQRVFFKDALWGNGRIICVERTVLLLQKPLLYSAAGADLSELTGPVRLDELDSTTQANSICAVRGTVVGVNERTAFSWPTCDRCSNGKLELCPQDRLLYCNQCSDVVTSPVLKMQLEVFLSCPSRSQSTLKVKLLQKTISSLLMSSTSDDGSYEVQSVLGKEVGLLNCYVHSVTSHPNCVGLEEIVLLEAAARH